MPAGHLAMDSYFKVLRAQEEVLRLNVEVPCLATFMRDDDAYLLKKQMEIQATHPALSHQIGIYHMEGGRFIVHHTKILNQIVASKGYSGSLLLGTHVTDEETVFRVIPAPKTVVHVPVDVTLDRDEDLEECYNSFILSYLHPLSNHHFLILINESSLFLTL